MMQYIEFTTRHSVKTFGNPIHDGKRPKKYRTIEGVRVDGETVEFIDNTIPERLGRYLIEAEGLRRRRIVNDCIAFVALMNSVRLEMPQHNPYREFDGTTFVDPWHINPVDDMPLVLANGFHDGVRLPRHIVLPAHLSTKQNYLHKLGDDGPLCMSNLQDALAMFSCDGAHTVK